MISFLTLISNPTLLYVGESLKFTAVPAGFFEMLSKQKRDNMESQLLTIFKIAPGLSLFSFVVTIHHSHGYTIYSKVSKRKNQKAR